MCDVCSVYNMNIKLKGRCCDVADGFIDAKDLEHHLGRSSGVAALIKEADKNKDGKIDYQEFCDLLKSQHS